MPKVTVETEITTTLVLSHEETQFLVDVLNAIGGPPRHSRRKHATALLEAMRETGKIDVKAGQKKDIDLRNNAIYFLSDLGVVNKRDRTL